MKHQVVRCRFERFKSLSPVGGNGDAVPSFFEQQGRKPTVHHIVFGD